ncbi:hypothetical protein WJ976_00375 [Achromobacter denitrificans]
MDDVAHRRVEPAGSIDAQHDHRRFLFARGGQAADQIVCGGGADDAVQGEHHGGAWIRGGLGVCASRNENGHRQLRDKDAQPAEHRTGFGRQALDRGGHGLVSSDEQRRAVNRLASCVQSTTFVYLFRGMMRQVMDEPALRAQLYQQSGGEVVGTGSKEFSQLIQAEAVRYGELARLVGGALP